MQLEQQLIGAYTEIKNEEVVKRSSSRKRNVGTPSTYTTTQHPPSTGKKIRKNLKSPANRPEVKQEKGTPALQQSIIPYTPLPTHTPTKPSMKDLIEEVKLLREAEKEATIKAASLHSTVQQLEIRLEEKDKEIVWLRGKM